MNNYNVYDLRFVDLNGNTVRKTPFTHPYNYDGYVLWKNTEDLRECDTIYSDRLYEWDWKKFNECSERIFGNTGQYFNNRNPEDIEKFLSLYFGKIVRLCAIMQYCNQTTGFPYWCFYYKTI